MAQVHFSLSSVKAEAFLRNRMPVVFYCAPFGRRANDKRFSRRRCRHSLETERKCQSEAQRGERDGWILSHCLVRGEERTQSNKQTRKSLEESPRFFRRNTFFFYFKRRRNGPSKTKMEKGRRTNAREPGETNDSRPYATEPQTAAKRREKTFQLFFCQRSVCWPPAKMTFLTLFVSQTLRNASYCGGRADARETKRMA